MILASGLKGWNLVSDSNSEAYYLCHLGRIP